MALNWEKINKTQQTTSNKTGLDWSKVATKQSLPQNAPYSTNGKFNPFALTQDVQNIAQTARREQQKKSTFDMIRQPVNTSAGDTIVLPKQVVEDYQKYEEEKEPVLKTPDIMKDNFRRFEDGYNFGDITKTGLETVGDTALTVAGTVGDVGLNIAKGVLSVPENMAKAGASAVAGVADLFGADDWANNVRRNVAYKNIYTGPTQKAIDVVDKASIAGTPIDNIASGVGQVGGTVAVSKVLGKAGMDNIKIGKFGMPVTAVLQGAGSGATEAYQKTDAGVGLENMTWREKAQNALKIVGSGAIAGMAEGAFGTFGVGENPFTQKISNALVAKASTPLTKVLTKMGFSGFGEAAEEFVEYLGNYALDNEIVNKIGSTDFSSEFDGKQVVQEMLSSFIVSALTQGGTSSIQMRNIANQQISQIEKEIGRKLTPNEIKQVANNIADQLLIESEEIDVSQSPQIEQTQPTNEVIPPTIQNQNTANMVRNNANMQNNVQNQPNIEQISQNNVEDAQHLQKTVQNNSELQEQTVETNVGNIPVAEYRDIMAQQAGFNDYADMRRQGYKLGNKYDVDTIETKSKQIQNIVQNDTERFSQQVDALMNGTFDKQNMVTVLSETPNVLQQLGFNNLPITITPNKLERIINEKGKQNREYHNLGIDVVKQLPDAITNPLDIIKSHNNSVVLTTYLADKNENSVIVSIQLDGKGNINNIEIPTNVMTSAYGRNNYDNYMRKNIENGNLLYDIDRGIIKKEALNTQGLQLSNDIKASENASSTTNVPINNIIQSNENYVNTLPTQAEQRQKLKEKTGFMLANEGDSYKRNMFNNNAKAINDLIKAKNITTKEIEDKIRQYKELNINAEENYKDIINELEKKRETAIKELEAKILQKEYELENKKDKTTKVAQTLRGQIANLKVRMTNINTDYNTRIERLKNIQIKKNANTLKKNNNQIIALEKKKADLEADYINKIDRLENRNATINKLKKQVSEDRLPTRKEIKQDIITETDMESINLDNTKDLSKFIMNNTTPLRVNEKIFDRETAKKINDTFFRPIKSNEADRIRFLNKERSEIQSLGIEPRSEESEYVQIYGEGEWVNPDTGEATPYTLDNLKKQFPENWEKIKNAAEVIRGKYDTYLDAVNKELNKMGYDSIPKLKNYFRHFEETTSLLDQIGIPSKADHLPTDLNGLTSDLRPGKNFFANALSRTGKKTTYDAITGIDGYLEGVSKLMYHTEDIQKLRTFDEYIRNKYGKEANLEGLNKQEFAEKVEQIQEGHLSEYAAWLSEYTNALAGKKSKMDRGTEEALGRRIYGTLNAVKKQVGSNLTGLNLNSALSNFISITQAGSKTSKYAMLEGFEDTVKNIFQDDGFINKSDFLTRRFGSDKLSKTAWEKMSNAGQIFMAGTDYFSANLITRSKYHEYLNKGYPENEAMRLADEFADRLMGGRALGDMPNIFNSKTLGILTQFQLENVNQFDSMFHDTKYEDRAAEQTKYEAKTLNEKLKSKLAKEKPEFYNSLSATLILGQLFAYAWAYNKVDEEMTGSGGAFDPIGIIEDLIKDFTNPNVSKGQAVANLAKNVIDVIPYANILTGGGRVPMTDAIPNIVDLLEGESNLGSELWKVANLALPTGGGQLRKTAQAAGALIKGGDYKTNANGEKQLKFPIAQEGNVAQRIAEGTQALLFGKWATPRGKEYIENGFKSLSAVETEGLEEAKKVGIDTTKYYEIRDSIKALKIPKFKDKTGKEKSVEGARKKMIKEELNSRKDLTEEQKRILFNIFYKREL